MVRFDGKMLVRRSDNDKMFDYIIAPNNENKPKERITNMYAKWIYTSVFGNTVAALAVSPTGALSLCVATSNETSRKT